MSVPPSTVQQALHAIRTLQARLEAERRARYEPVAIIGMGARYPGAEGLDAFWDLLARGGDAVGAVPAARWDSAALFDADPSAPGKIANRRGGFLERLEEFDAAFFGISPREAPHIDPRQRVLLEIAWEALEHAGIVPGALAGSATGVFIATLANDYDHLLCDRLERIEAYSGAGTANSITANRLSYFFDFHGPSLALDTACSGSLLAVHLGCESLRSGESSLVLAGGVNVTLMPKSNVFFSKAGALSPDGVCRAFDAAANGMVRSDGAGVVVLKLLAAAQRDGDRILAVIRGSAVNHDGRSNGIMAPNGAAQEAVLREAYRRAGVAPGEVQYVEAHGTATKLGDPIEAGALTAVLGDRREPGFVCRMGSLKTNVGHTEAAAGVGGLIKTALALRHRQLPPSLHYEQPNPFIRLETLPLAVQRELGRWPAPERPLLAGVSGFGFGGTNAHVVLQEAPAAASRAEGKRPAPALLPLSARTPAALHQTILDYEARLEGGGDWLDVCRAAALRRTHFEVRCAAMGNSAEELRDRLRAAAERPGAAAAPGRIVFVYSGQGSHWAGMGRELAAREPVFRAALEECARLLARHVSWSLLEELGREGEASRIDATDIAQPAIFAIQCALTDLWRSWGICPQAVIGHSLGEAAAAAAAGILTREEALCVVVARSRLMKPLDGQGATAAVGLDLESARRAIQGCPHVGVAGSNSPGTSVLSGDPVELAEVIRRLEAERVFARLLPGVRIAFHSPQMEALRPALEAELRGLQPRAGAIPMISTVTGEIMPGEGFTAAYWGRNLREPFLFAQGMERILEEGCAALVEIAPHPVLSSALGQCLRGRVAAPLVVPSLRRQRAEAAVMLASLGTLYEAGAEVAWATVYSEGAPVVDLPAYPWQRQRYWYDQIESGAAPAAAPPHPRSTAAGHSLLGVRMEIAPASACAVWEKEFDASRPAFLAEHKFAGEVLLPGSAWLEMAMRAGGELLGRRVEVRDAVFERALPLREGEAQRVQVVVERREDGASFQAWRRQGDDWERCAVASLAPSEAIVEAALPELVGWTRGEAAEHFRNMHAHGLEYGPAFRSLQTWWRRSGAREAVAELRLPASVAAADTPGLHPALLDAVLQTAAVAAGYDYAYLPRSVGRWHIERPYAGRLWCHARVSGTPGDPSLEAEIALFDAERRTLGAVRGLRLQLATRRQNLSAALLEEHWIPAEPIPAVPAAPASWLVVSGGGGLTEMLRAALVQRGQRVTIAAPGEVFDSRDCDGVMDLSGLDTQPREESAACGRALRLTQSLLGRTPAPRLWFVTRGALAAGEGGRVTAPEQAPLHGLALATAREHPELRCASVDLDPAPGAGDVAALVQELLQPDGEDRMAWRDGRRWMARLEKAPPPLAPPAQLDPEAAYLITGGLGALGLRCARLLVNLGARHLFLSGRRGGQGREAELAALRAGGAEVEAVALDVADLAGVTAWMEQLRASRRPLRGVLHAAGVLDDGMLAQQTEARIAAVMAPKVSGAWNLHQATMDQPLDFFVLFSSAASLVGSAGQANYAAANAFLDALAHHRRGCGLAGLSLNWGAWDEAGMAQAEGIRARLEARGVGLIEPDAALELLAGCLAGQTGAPQLGVFPAAWTLFLRQFPSVPPRFRRLAPASAQVEPAAHFRANWEALPASQREPALRGFVHGQLAAVLGFRGPAAAAAILPHQRFFELGMDSLLALELRNRLEAGLEIPLSATLAFDYPSVQALTEHLLGQLPAGEAELDALSDLELEQELARELGRGAAGDAS